MLEASSETSRLEDQITDEELERRESVAVKLLRRRKQMASIIAASRRSRYKVLLSIRMMPMSRSRSKRRQS